MTLNQGKRAEMSLTFGFPGLWSNPESPFLSHHHTCPFGSIPLAAQEKMQQPGSSDSHVPGVVHTLINEDKSPIVLMLRGWNDTRRKSVPTSCCGRRGDSFFILLLGNSCQHISISSIQPCTRAEDPQGLQASQHKLHYCGTFPAS